MISSSSPRLWRSSRHVSGARCIAVALLLLPVAPAALAYDPAVMNTCKEGNGDAAVRACDAILKTETDYARVTALTGRASARYGLKQYDAALADIDDAIKAYPNADRYAFRATINSALRNNDAAIADLTASLKLERSPLRYAQRADAYSAKGESDLAIADLTVALETDNDHNYLAARGAEYMRKRDYDRAIADFDAALKLRPNLSIPLFGRGLAKTFKGDPGGKSDIAEVKVRSTAEQYFLARGLQLDKLAEAQGSAFCSQIKRIASQAQDGFRKLRAGANAGFAEVARMDPNLRMKEWHSTEMLPGAEQCNTSISDNPELLFRLHPQMTCTWYFYDRNQKLAESAARLAHALTDCHGKADLKPDEKGYFKFATGEAVFSVQPDQLPSYSRITFIVEKVLTPQQEESCFRAKMEKPQSKSRDMKICLDSFRPD